MISRESFGWQVKRALASLHDPVGLQTNRLVELLAAHPPAGLGAAAYLRQALRDAIESLRPAAQAPSAGVEWLGYRILWMRYVQSRSRYAICDELGLSRTSYYRHHREALEAVIGVLWERYGKHAAQPGPGAIQAGGSAEEQVVQQAAKLARSSRPQPLNPKTVVDGMMQVLAPLAERQGLTVEATISPSLPMMYADPAILRQILLNLLTEALRLAAKDGLQLTLIPGDGEIIWQLRGLPGGQVTEQNLATVTGFVVGRTLLASCGGRLWLERDASGSPTLWFTVPTAPPRAILIIDDDDDTIALYERYLRTSGYLLQVARDSRQVHELVAGLPPDLVLLDVLMPEEDGWGILQHLKTMPETGRIPVVICSVLDQPDLALALGAAEVLRKPISQSALLRTVQTLLAQGDIAG